MSTKITKTEIQQLQRWHEAAQKKAQEAIQAAVTCGSMLNEIAAQLAHGEWYPFLETVGINRETARRYRKLADEFANRGNFLLPQGANLCDLYREFGLLPPREGGGNRLGKDELDRRNAEKSKQFEFHFIELGLGEVHRWRRDNGGLNPFTLVDRPVLEKKVADLREALALAEEALTA